MMARSTTRSNQRPDTLMQDRICQVDETSCNARPDHTCGVIPDRIGPSASCPVRGNLGNAGCPVLPVEGIGLDVIQAPKREPRIMRYEPRTLNGPPSGRSLQGARHSAVDDRRVLNGLFWVLRSGAPWRDLPETCGPRTTCYDRFVRWRQAGVWDRIMDTYCLC
jgi:hypothetical protein